MANPKFIQEAITPKHKGRLKRFAQEHDTLTKKGTIDIPATQKAIDKLPSGENKLHRQRELNLAKTLRGLRNR